MLTNKKIEPINGNVPFPGLPMGVRGDPAMAGDALVLALETFDHYTGTHFNKTPGETHDI